MRLTPKQRRVLANSLAWCSLDYQPTEGEISDLFASTDRGVAVRPSELLNGWSAYYANPFEQVERWQREGGNPPERLPAAWIRDCLYSPEGWAGWFDVLTSFFLVFERMGDDARYRLVTIAEWLHIKPAFEQTYIVAATLHGRREYDDTTTAGC